MQEILNHPFQALAAIAILIAFVLIPTGIRRKDYDKDWHDHINDL